MDRTDDDSLPPTPRTRSLDEPRTPEPPSDVDDDDEVLNELDDRLRHLRIRMRNKNGERNALRDRNQALEDELSQLREASRRIQAQLDACAARLQAAENGHAAEAERLSRQVAREQRRAARAEEALGSVRSELAAANREIGETAESVVQNDTLQTLRRSFGDRIAEALTSTPVRVPHERYRMTGTTPARGPDRRRHREFEPADGPGTFVMFRGRLAWIKIWLQTQA